MDFLLVADCANGSVFVFVFFFFNDTATTEIYTLSLHDALPIPPLNCQPAWCSGQRRGGRGNAWPPAPTWRRRSEEHTSELQSRPHLVCRLLLEKKKTTTKPPTITKKKN